MKAKILIVDDEKDILELIEFNLKKNGYHTDTSLSGEEALEKINNNEYDIIILDLMLPGIDGLDLCRIIKSDKKKSMIPIIMLTAKSEEVDKITGFEMGADHYITKPFSPRELLAVIKATLRRTKQRDEEQSEIVERGILKIHTGKREVLIKGNEIELTNLEFQILHILAKKSEWVISRQQLIELIHKEDVLVIDRSVDVHIASLRKKLGKYSSMIETVRSVGYRFKEIEK